MIEHFEGGGGGGGSRTPSRTPDNLLSQDYAEIILGLGTGPWKGMVPGVGATPGDPRSLQNFYLGDTPLQNHANGESNFKDFKVTEYKGAEGEPNIERVLGGDSANIIVGTSLGQNIAVVRTTPTSLRKTSDNPGIDRLEIRILFNRLVRTDDEGDYNHTAYFTIEYKASNNAFWTTWENPSQVTGKTTSGYVKDFLIPVTPLTNADYDIRVTKLSPDNGTQEVVDMTWESIQAVTLAKPAYPGLAKLHIVGRVSQQFSSLPSFSGIYEGQIVWVPDNYNPETRTYNETTPWMGGLVKKYTNNPAWILYWLIMDESQGLAHYYLNVAALKQEFYEAAKWCDEQVPSGVVGVTQPRFTFNALIDAQKLGLELLAYVAGSFNSTIFDDGKGLIRLRTDAPKTPKQLFTPETVINGEFNYSFTDLSTRYNEITVQFINPDLNWSNDERLANIDASAWIAENGIIPTSFQAIGCTDEHEAIRRANDRLLTCNTEVTTVTFDTYRFGMNCELFDTILIADPISGWSSGGRIKSYASGVVQLRDPLYVETVAPCNLKIQTYSGIAQVTVVPPTTGLVYSLTVTEGVFPSNIPERTQFTFENNTNIGFAKPFRVTTITEIEGDVNKWRISGVEINPNKYADSASGTVSTPIKYDYTIPTQPVLPLALVITNLPPQVSSDGTLNYRVRVSWEIPFQSNTDHYELDTELAESGTVKTEVVFGDQVYIENLKDAKRYNFSLWAVTAAGKRSERNLVVENWLVPTKSISLENVSGLSLSQTNKGWVASWNPPANIPDIWGTRIKVGAVGASWASLPNNYFSLGVTQELPWLAAGNWRIQAKYINTSENESGNATVYDQVITAPGLPIINSKVYSVGVCEILFDTPVGSQPLKQIRVKRGTSTSTATTAAISDYTIGPNQGSLTIAPDLNVATRLFIASVDVAGNQGPFILVEIAADGGIPAVIDAIKGDIDETWVTPGLLDHINFGDTAVAGSLPNQIQKVASEAQRVFDPYVSWQFNGVNDGWAFHPALTIGSVTTGPIFLTSDSGADGSNILVRTLTGFEKLNGVTNRIIRIRLRRSRGTDWIGIAYYGVEGGHFAESTFYKQIPEPKWGADGWGIAEWDMASLTVGGNDWITSSTINYLRFDFSYNSGATFQVDWIAVGSLGVGVTRAIFQQEITARDTGDTALAQSLTTLSATVGSNAAIVQTEITTRADQVGYLGAQWATRVSITSGGVPVIGGIAIAGYSSPTAGPTFDFAIRANKIAFLPPAGVSDTPTNMFAYYSTPTTLPNGLTIQPGLYLTAAYIDYISATQIDTRGLSIRDASGNVIFSAGVPLSYSRVAGRPTTYRVIATGANATTQPNGPGIYNAETNVLIPGTTVDRSYTIEKFLRSNGTLVFSRQYDVYGNGEGGRRNGADLAADLNAMTADYILCLHTYDEPYQNRLTVGLEEAMYRNGASRAVFGSPNFKSRSAYILIAVGNCGEAQGFESYAGDIPNDPDSWCDVTFAIQNGNLITGSGATPKGLGDYGFTGSLNATTDIILINDTPENLTVTGNSVKKTAGGSGWNSAVHSRDSYAGGAYCSFKIDDYAGLMIGLNSDPLADNSYSSIDYAIYCAADHNVYRYVNNTGLNLGRSYSPGQVFSATYDGVNFRMYQDGVLIDTYPLVVTAPLFLDSSFDSVGGSVSNLRFGPLTNNDFSSIGGSTKPANNATYGATFDVNVYGAITASNSTTYIASAAIKSAMIEDLRTSNYTESGGNATAGAKLSSTGTALKVAAGSFQVGGTIFTDYWVRLVFAIDGNSYGRLIWRGNNDTSVRGGSPNIDCLALYTGTSSQTVVADTARFKFQWRLQPTSDTDNLDSMRHCEIQVYHQSGGGSPLFVDYATMSDRLYYSPTHSNTANASAGQFEVSYKPGHSANGETANSTAPNLFSGHLRVRILNAYGPSDWKWFHGNNVLGSQLTADYTAPSGAPPAGGGGGGGDSGGGCPAPWVTIALEGGREVSASQLVHGSVVVAVNDTTLEPIPGGGLVDNPKTIWADRIELTLEDGSKSEWSQDHRFYVVSRGWLAIRHITPGMILAGSSEKIVKSLRSTGKGPVISFTVKGAGTYFAGQILSHNRKVLP